MKMLTKAIAAIMLMTTAVFAVGCTPEENNDADVKVTTNTPQDITQTSAVCGGEVFVSQGLTLNELGVCWGTNPNPTVEDSHLSTLNWSEPYVCTITGLASGTTYHVRAYALCGLEYYYGEDRSFTTVENGGGGGGNGTYNGHDYIDLGLPSGTLWATCNVGADNPEDYGDYFAWGETEPKTTYHWGNYKYCYDSCYYLLTKYCSDPSYGFNGFTDTLTVLLPEDDAVTANWGDGWRMPTEEEWEELCDHTTSTWTTWNGVEGRLFTASNGNSLFLPAAGSRWNEDFNRGDSYGTYWSSLLSADYPDRAWNFGFYSVDYTMNYGLRGYGLSVRAVRSARQN